MRIVSGIYGGRTLQTVPGKSTRPTTDRVREAWASTLTTLVPRQSFAGLTVLDAFAGSGALGLELLSRGAARCVLIDHNKQAFRTLKTNSNTLQLTREQARVCDADSLSPRLPELLQGEDPFALVALDPPYDLAGQKVLRLLTTLAQAQLLAPHCLISYEHSSQTGTLIEALSSSHEEHLPLTLVRSKRYGTMSLDYYRCNQG